MIMQELNCGVPDVGDWTVKSWDDILILLIGVSSENKTGIVMLEILWGKWRGENNGSNMICQ